KQDLKRIRQEFHHFWNRIAPSQASAELTHLTFMPPIENNHFPTHSKLANFTSLTHLHIKSFHRVVHVLNCFGLHRLPSLMHLRIFNSHYQSQLPKAPAIGNEVIRFEKLRTLHLAQPEHGCFAWIKPVL